jgi:hypothetical protein
MSQRPRRAHRTAHPRLDRVRYRLRIPRLGKPIRIQSDREDALPWPVEFTAGSYVAGGTVEGLWIGVAGRRPGFATVYTVTG